MNEPITKVTSTMVKKYLEVSMTLDITDSGFDNSARDKIINTLEDLLLSIYGGYKKDVTTTFIDADTKYNNAADV